MDKDKGLILSERSSRDLDGTEAGGAAGAKPPPVQALPRAQRCANCRAFNAMKSECRRKSPVMVPLPQMGPGGQLVGFKTAGLYPATQAELWCLEWVTDRPPVPPLPATAARQVEPKA